MNYKEANELLIGRCRNSRKLANNTYLHRNGEDICVRLHNTDVVTFKPNGEAILDSGGWKTVTTKERINKYSPVGVFQNKGQWYIGDWNSNIKECPLFFDGMIISKSGKVKRPKHKDGNAEKLLKLINAYCKELKGLKELPKPSLGDCWFCSISAGDKNKPLGDFVHLTQHLEDHLKEKYIHGSLILNAIEWAGCRNPALLFEMDVRVNIVNAVRRYFKAKLGLAR